MPVFVSVETENAGAVTEPAAGLTGAVMLAEPLIDCPQIVLAVPQFAVVMLAEPLNEVPLIVRAVCKVVAVAALPVVEADDPVTEIGQLPVGVPPKVRLPLVVTLPVRVNPP